MPPKPRGHNASVYIIICSRRIKVLAATSHTEKIIEASDAAAQVVSQLELLHPKETINAGPITELQHYMMTNLFTMTPAEAEEKVAEMFSLLDALEDVFEEREY